MSGYAWTIPVHRMDAPPASGTGAPLVGWRFVWGDYFRVMGIPGRRGRAFATTDDASAPPVVMVNALFAQRYFAGQAARSGSSIRWA